MTINITINGGLTSMPELRYSSNGVPIASFSVASTERYKKGDEWVDGKRLYLRCSAFREIAENIVSSMLDKGAQVSVTGKLHTREYEDTSGQKRSSTELDVTDFSVSLKRATVQVTKTGQQPRSQPATATNTPAPSTHTPQPAQDVWGAPDGQYGDSTDSPF